jgi:myo-inositol-1(or 4)-monophosphatase
VSGRYRSGDLQGWLRLAKEAAREAGGLLANAASRSLTVTAEVGRDIKLEMDKTSEACLQTALRQQTSFEILSEEGGILEGRSKDTLRWIVDPLDGSFNYLRGIPLCCVSVGLWEKDEPLLGAVYDFNRDELFSGIVGEGAWLNGAAMQASKTPTVDRAVLCAGFPVGTDFSPEALHEYVGLVAQYKKMRQLGSAALMLAYVAAGRADAYYERDIKIWDVAAGLALVQAAGGRIVCGRSDAPQALTVYAGAPLLPQPGR